MGAWSVTARRWTLEPFTLAPVPNGTKEVFATILGRCHLWVFREIVT